MSIETVVFLVLFTLLPLLEQLARRRREARERRRRAGSPQPGPAPPPRRPLPAEVNLPTRAPRPAPPPLPQAPVPPIPRTPPGHVPLPGGHHDLDEDDEVDAPVVVARPPRPRPPVTRPQAAGRPQVAAPQRAARARAGEPGAVPARRHRAGRLRAVVRSPDGLAQAVALMAILGPPRGIRPYEGPDASR